MKKDRKIDNPQSHEQLLLFKNVQPEHPASEQQSLDNNGVAEEADMTQKLDCSHGLETSKQKVVVSSPAPDLSPEEHTSHQQEEDIQTNSKQNSSRSLTKSPVRIANGHQACK